MNAIKHGCKGDATKQVQCAVSFDAAGELVIVVRDPGAGFDPKDVPNPLEGNNLSMSGRGGLINELMDTGIRRFRRTHGEDEEDAAG